MSNSSTASQGGNNGLATQSAPSNYSHVVGQPILEPREAGLTIVGGAQGTGKTYTTLHEIIDYLRDHPNRKVLIYDVNGEFSYEECVKHGVNINIPKLGTTVQDIQAFTYHQYERIRRIVPIDPTTGEMMNIACKRKLLELILKHFRAGFLFVEDMNKYLLQVRHVEEVVSTLISLRHANLDVIVHLQSISKIDPTLWENVKYIRMHYQEDNVDRLKQRGINNWRLFKIAQLLIDHQYKKVGNERFYLTVHRQKNKLTGKFSEKDFYRAFYTYLKLEKNELKDCILINRLGKDDTSRVKAIQYLFQENSSMYGNAV